MLRYLFVLVFLTALGVAHAQTSFSTSDIPSDMRYHAGAVVRNAETIVEVHNEGRIDITERKTITIFNESGAHAANIIVYYDKMRKIKSIKGTIYNEFGVGVRKILEKSFTDASAISGYSLYEDDRVKYFSPAYKTYPYTIAYEINTQWNQTLIFPTWYPTTRNGVSVEQASYTLICPADFEIRYKENNYSGELVRSKDEKGNKKYVWQVANKQALTPEPYSPSFTQFATSVTVAPVHFSYGGVKGSFSDWEGLGRWTYAELLHGRDKVPEELKATVIALTKDVDDPVEKAKIIYQYVQQHTRYISVQVGIGGFRPATVAETQQLGYGDCKALSLYTHALLNVVGIPSYYCVVEAGDSKENPKGDFANMQFGNHIILCLPFPGDTTWLECTSQKIGFGYLSDFTDDRTVLACTPDGGRLLHTTKYTPEQNKQVRVAEFAIDSTGDLKGTVKTHYEGLQFDEVERYSELPTKERHEKLAKKYHIDNLNILDVQFEKIKGKIPSIDETISMEARNFAAVNGNRIYLFPNVLNRKLYIPQEVKQRKTSVVVDRGYTDTDEIKLKIPDGYVVEYMPESLVEETDFGKYTLAMQQEGDTVTLKRTTYYKQGAYLPAAYEKLISFYTKIYKYDNKKLVLVHK